MNLRAVKNPVGVGETYGVRREEIRYNLLRCKTAYGSLHLGRRQHGLDAPADLFPIGLGLLVHGDEVTEQQEARHAGDVEELAGQVGTFLLPASSCPLSLLRL